MRGADKRAPLVKGNWVHDPIDWAIVMKITTGTSPTTFSPDAT